MQENLFNFSFNMEEIEELRKLKNFQNENEKKTFLDTVSKMGMFLQDDALKFLFDLSDDEFNTNEIQNAIKKGELYAGMKMGEFIYSKALDGEKWAILKLQEMNKGKQKQEITSRTVEYKNANNNMEMIKELEKQSIFGKIID